MCKNQIEFISIQSKMQESLNMPFSPNLPWDTLKLTNLIKKNFKENLLRKHVQIDHTVCFTFLSTEILYFLNFEIGF